MSSSRPSLYRLVFFKHTHTHTNRQKKKMNKIKNKIPVSAWEGVSFLPVALLPRFGAQNVVFFARVLLPLCVCLSVCVSVSVWVCFGHFLTAVVGYTHCLDAFCLLLLLQPFRKGQQQQISQQRNSNQAALLPRLARAPQTQQLNNKTHSLISRVVFIYDTIH